MKKSVTYSFRLRDSAKAQGNGLFTLAFYGKFARKESIEIQGQLTPEESEEFLHMICEWCERRSAKRLPRSTHHEKQVESQVG